jgi:hypothetical protein
MFFTRPLKIFACLVATTVATLLCEHPLIASSVGVNYSGDPGSTEIFAAEAAGVTPQRNWINVPSQAPGTNLVLPNLTKDTAGVASPSGIKLTTQYNSASAQVFGVVTNEGGALNTPDRKLMQNYIDVLGPVTGVGGTTTLKLEGLAGFGPFDLILYSGGTIPHGDPDRVAQYKFFNGTTSGDPLLVTRLIRNKANPYNVPNDAYKESIGNGTVAGTLEGNYARISNLNPSSGTLFILAEALTGGPQRGAIQGFQLVQVPEPSTIGLLAVAAVSLLRRRRSTATGNSVS